MRAVPMALREGSYAMGATRFQTAIRVVTPAAFSGIAAAYILGISRAVGETMILAVAAGMQPNLTWNPLEPAATITAYIVQVALGDLPHGIDRLSDDFRRGPDAGPGHAVLQRARPHAAQALPPGLLIMSEAAKVREIRALIAAHKRWDLVFAMIGLLALMVGVLTFVALFGQMVIEGAPRLSWDFFTHFPVPQARSGGHTLGLGRLDAGDDRDRRDRGAARGRRRGVSRGIRAQELDDRSHRDQRDQSRRRAVHRLRPARAGAVRLPVRPRPEHPDGRTHAGPADSAGGDRRHARGDPRDTRRDSRGRLCARRHQVADHLGPHPAVFAWRAS